MGAVASVVDKLPTMNAPSDPGYTCNFPCGLFVPMPTLPLEMIRILSVASPVPNRSSPLTSPVLLPNCTYAILVASTIFCNLNPVDAQLDPLDSLSAVNSRAPAPLLSPPNLRISVLFPVVEPKVLLNTCKDASGSVVPMPTLPSS